MIDIRTTVIPKSDQINADSLIGQTLTIKVTKVSLLTEADQPIAIGFEGDGGRPYKPCKIMRRVMVNCWGPDGNAYIGRSMTIYRDAAVMFGGVATGGIRISHMSHIDAPVTMALTVTRANRKPFTVQPLAAQAMPRVTNGVPEDVQAVRELGDKAAAAGIDALRQYWTGLSKAGRIALGNGTQLAAWKAIAESADAPAVDFDDKPPLGDRFYREPEQTKPADPAVTSGPQHEPTGGISAPAEAASQGPLEGVTASPPGAAAPSDLAAAIDARKAEILATGDARAQAGTVALRNFLEELRKDGEDGLVTSIRKGVWNDAAKAADTAKGTRK